MAKATEYIKIRPGDDYIDSPVEIYIKGDWRDKPLHFQIKSKEHDPTGSPWIDRKNGLAGGSDSQLVADSFANGLTKTKIFFSGTDTDLWDPGVVYGEVVSGNTTVSKFKVELLPQLISTALQGSAPENSGLRVELMTYTHTLSQTDIDNKYIPAPYLHYVLDATAVQVWDIDESHLFKYDRDYIIQNDKIIWDGKPTEQLLEIGNNLKIFY